jgi:TolB-like protein/Flp pilus assembly protein TadD
MKHCPECNKNYADPTLSFCLNDGSPLVYGAAVEEPETAILSRDDPREARTRTIDANVTAPKETKPVPKRIVKVGWILGALAIVVILGSVFAYRYFNSAGSGQITSIAVMPFVNQSDNADLENQSDGMTESLLNSLGQVPGLSVKARSSVFRYKDKDVDAATIGRELGVQAVLNGRVVERGDALTLFLELVDTATADRIWGERYDRNQTQLVSLQSEIARDVSEKLRLKLSGEDVRRIAKNDTANPEAYRLYLQGRYYWNKRSFVETGKAIGFFQQAIDLDPNYAKAYAGLADAVAQPSDVVPHLEREAKARAAVERALSLDGNMAEAHSSLAHILLRYDADFAGAERELDIAVKLDPKWSDTYQRYAQLYIALGKFNEAISRIRAGLEIEPYNLPLNNTYGITLTYARRYDESIAQLTKALALDSENSIAESALVAVYSLKGMYAEAVENRIRVAKLDGNDQFAETIQEAFTNGGWPAVIRAELTRYEGRNPIPDGTSHCQKARYLAALGKKDDAFAELERSLADREHLSLVFIKTDPRFDPLRDDPRFPDILRRIGFR